MSQQAKPRPKPTRPVPNKGSLARKRWWDALSEAERAAFIARRAAASARPRS